MPNHRHTMGTVKPVNQQLTHKHHALENKTLLLLDWFLHEHKVEYTNHSFSDTHFIPTQHTMNKESIAIRTGRKCSTVTAFK